MEIDRFAILSLPLVVVHVPTSPSEVTNQVSSLILCVFPLPIAVFFWSLAISWLRHDRKRPFFRLPYSSQRSCAVHPGASSVSITCTASFTPSKLGDFARMPSPSPPLDCAPREYFLLNRCTPRAVHLPSMGRGEAGFDDPLTRFESIHASN